MKIVLCLLLLMSCSRILKAKPKEGIREFTYLDANGTFRLKRESKLIKQKVVSRVQLLDSGSDKLLEKSIIVSQLGTVQAGKTRALVLRPLASEFSVWLEGKKYATKMNLNLKAKSMTVTMDSPDPKWSGVREVPFPKGKNFCFFSQIPECLYHSKLLEAAQENKNRKFSFYVLWESFPYTTEQYTGVGKTLFSIADVKFDSELKNLLRYIIEIEGQTLMYQFGRSYDLQKVSWIPQGITIVPPGEEPSNIEE